MGQGLNTKVAMAAALCLGIPLEHVHIGEGNSHILPHSGTTGGSNTSENCVAAVLEACDLLNCRLQPYVSEGESFCEAVQKAFEAGENLVATVVNHGDWNKQSAEEIKAGDPPYNVYGACVSEVLVDVLTGEVVVERVDIMMDLGNQLNAAVDIGQIQGGFVMALGYLLTEEQSLAANGKRQHLGSWDYKLPTAYDIPVEFNVNLLKNNPNPNGVKHSKAVAEPVMHLVASPYLAVKNAIYAARIELGYKDEWRQLNVPLTPQAVQEAINVTLDELSLP